MSHKFAFHLNYTTPLCFDKLSESTYPTVLKEIWTLPVLVSQ